MAMIWGRLWLFFCLWLRLVDLIAPATGPGYTWASLDLPKPTFDPQSFSGNADG